jgi:hypothetical protein
VAAVSVDSLAYLAANQQKKSMRLYLAGAFFSTTCLFFLLLQSPGAAAQLPGCKDPMARNYNPSATANNGTCGYDTVRLRTVFKAALGRNLSETSGLQMAGGSLWSFNDSGNPAEIYRVDTTSGAVLQSVILEGATNVDWEDIAFDGTYLYIGDFGNNATGGRTDLKIYKFPLTAIPEYTTNPVVTIPSGQIDVINFVYSNQVPVENTGTNNTRFDCEAMVVDSGRIHLFTKNWVDLNTVHYVIEGVAPGDYTATPRDTLQTNYLVTGADKLPGSSVVVLIGYRTGLPFRHFMHLLSDFSGDRIFNGNVRMFKLQTALTMAQAEGVAFSQAGWGFISGERIAHGITIRQRLRSFNLYGYLPLYVLPDQP